MGATKSDILIVGGGITGIATALMLARKGRPVHVLEREEKFVELGAGLQLAPNALRVLDRLGVLEQVLQHAVFPKALVLLDIASGKRLKTVDLGPNFVEHFGYPYIVVHRSDLLTSLLEATRSTGLVSLEASKLVTGVDDRESEVHVTCADGTIYIANAVIAADGLWSSVRKQLFGDDGVKTPGYVAYRGTLPISEVPADTDTNELLIWAGPNMHLVQYPVRGGTLYNQVAVFKTIPGAPHTNDWGGPDELLAHFSKACEVVKRSVERVSHDRRWPLFDRDPIHTWTRNRVALIGDAAHPMLQFLAQGACQGLEDAVCMGERIAESGADYPRAFVLFQNSRVLRTGRVQLTARFFEHFWHPSGVSAEARDRYLENHPANRYDEFDWLYGPNPSPY